MSRCGRCRLPLDVGAAIGGCTCPGRRRIPRGTPPLVTAPRPAAKTIPKKIAEVRVPPAQIARERVLAHLTTKHGDDQLVSSITWSLNIARGRVLAALRELDRDGLAVRLSGGRGWVLTRYQGKRTSEYQSAVIDGPHRWGRAPATLLIEWINEQPDPIDRAELLRQIDACFPNYLAKILGAQR